jgi:hypothetical protein
MDVTVGHLFSMLWTGEAAMQSPRITPETAAPGTVDLHRRFVVTEDGFVAGKALFVGDAVVVGGRADIGDWVVLGARGLGRPRFGRVTVDGLIGDAGEVCSEARWEVLGKVMAVVPGRRRAPRRGEKNTAQLGLVWGAVAA